MSLSSGNCAYVLNEYPINNYYINNNKTLNKEYKMVLWNPINAIKNDLNDVNCDLIRVNFNFNNNL